MMSQATDQSFFSDFATWYGLASMAGVLFFYRALILREIVRLLGIPGKVVLLASPAGRPLAGHESPVVCDSVCFGLNC
jgi:hypothetical protein